MTLGRTLYARVFELVLETFFGVVFGDVRVRRDALRTDFFCASSGAPSDVMP